MKNLIFTSITTAITLALAYIILTQTNHTTANSNAGDLPFVKDMNFTRFMGLWYSIASLPDIIESNCRCPITVDTLTSDLVIDLSESCLLFGRNVTSPSKAVATVNGYGNWTNVNGPIKAPYWILKID